jgi:hypothetical protein
MPPIDSHKTENNVGGRIRRQRRKRSNKINIETGYPFSAQDVSAM